MISPEQAIILDVSAKGFSKRINIVSPDYIHRCMLQEIN